jgi:lipoprotein-anchoring transpeptidase ErfK/SrfK
MRAADRRVFLIAVSSSALALLQAGCATAPQQAHASGPDPMYQRTEVAYMTRERPGTIIVDPDSHFLYLVQANGRALRYGVGVGREGYGWSGEATVRVKREWPDWYPTKEYLADHQYILKFIRPLQSGDGVPGGPTNPMGARALYLWQGNKDTLYRIHGTNEPQTIGTNVSAGCIRMTNADITDLYGRVPMGARVVVLPSRAAPLS